MNAASGHDEDGEEANAGKLKILNRRDNGKDGKTENTQR